MFTPHCITTLHSYTAFISYIYIYDTYKFLFVNVQLLLLLTFSAALTGEFSLWDEYSDLPTDWPTDLPSFQCMPNNVQNNNKKNNNLCCFFFFFFKPVLMLLIMLSLIRCSREDILTKILPTCLCTGMNKAWVNIRYTYLSVEGNVTLNYWS